MAQKNPPVPHCWLPRLAQVLGERWAPFGCHSVPSSPWAVTNSITGRGLMKLVPGFFPESAPLCHGCVYEGERSRIFHLCCPVIIPVWKTCSVFPLSRWAKEGPGGVWHRHGRARDRAGGRGDTVPVQKIPEEKSRVPVLVATSQRQTKWSWDDLSRKSEITQRCMYRNYQYLKPHWQITTRELVRDSIPDVSRPLSSVTHHFTWCCNKKLGWSN